MTAPDNDDFLFRCDKLSGNSGAMSGDSETKFKSSLLRYLQYYEVRILEVFHTRKLSFLEKRVYFYSHHLKTLGREDIHFAKIFMLIP